jgi:hypothetical protein
MFLSFVFCFAVPGTCNRIWTSTFSPLEQEHLSRWEIFSLLVSLGLSVFTAEFVFRYCKKYIHQGNPPL